MSLKLYFDLLSQPSRALYILLKQCNIPFEEVPIALRKGEHLSEKYENEISRFKKVPVIDDNGFKLTESIAILRYLSREKNIPDNWYPKDSKLQARVDEFLEWQHISLRYPSSMYCRVKVLAPLMGIKVDEKEVAGYKSAMIETLDSIEPLWLQGKPFINGDKISAADLWGACEVEQPRTAWYDPRDGRAELSAWLDRVKQATNPYYDRAHFIVNKIVQKQKPK